MAIPEACGLWIEQRIEEELQQKKDTGASLREIGRQVAAEVERYFETKVNPRTIEKRAERSATNVAHTENPTTTSDSEEIKQIKRQPAKDGTMRGGPRPGAGRKMKSNDGQPVRKEKNEFTGYDLDSLPMRYARMAVLEFPPRVRGSGV
jgi:NAD-dependent DNA ligase